VFPRTKVGGVNLSRLVIGTNWFLGYAHQTKARSTMIQQRHNAGTMAEIMGVFAADGVNALVGPNNALLYRAVKMAEQKSGKKLHRIITPSIKRNEQGPDWDDCAKALDECAKAGTSFCWPHTTCIDALYDGLTGKIRHIERICSMIRQRDMIPGLSTHLPEVILSADRNGYDVASYISIYNAAGFMMPIEIDWIQNIIHGAEKPVTTIKPMAAGRLMPYVGLPFSWSTIRPCDLVTVGTTTPDEAREVLEISWACLQGRKSNVELQVTRSKQSLMKKFTEP
jgi:hypothetical protein